MSGGVAVKELPSHRAYLMLSVPLIISTLTTPLLGVVDTAVVGHLYDPAYLGGTAIGTLIFNTMYWLFGFLRVSTSGFSAQARGKNDLNAGIGELIRPLTVASLLGCLFIALQTPILQASLWLMKPGEEVGRWAEVYFGIRIWGAPLTLVNYVLLGWLMGMSHIRYTMVMQISMNTFNMILAIWFAQGMGWGVAGVAAATLFAEGLALVLGVYFVLRSPYMDWKKVRLKGQFGAEELKRMFRTNGDLFIRTVCLLTMFNLFTAKSASFGPSLLAANSILLQIHYLMAYFFDGFGNASSILAGQARGAESPALLKRTLALSWFWSMLTAVLITIVYFAGESAVLTLFSDNPQVVEAARSYSDWLLLFPLCTGSGLVLYGVFTGMTMTGPVRNSMLLSLAVYAAAIWFFVPLSGNHGLWLAFILFGLGRSVFLLMYVPGLGSMLRPGETNK